MIQTREYGFHYGLYEPKVTARIVKDEGMFPNNPRLPLLYYETAFELPAENSSAHIEEVISSNNWSGMWTNGIYDFHHYHSTAHEVLACYSGRAEVQFGGPAGIIIPFKAGDAIIIPAGVAHCNLGSTRDFKIVGAYPEGQHHDMCYGKGGERRRAEQSIAEVPLPLSDPVYGPDGPLLREWRK